MGNIIQELESRMLAKDIPDFSQGDTVIVHVKVKEGERERLQAFEGMVIGRRNNGYNSSFHRAQDILRRRRGTHLPAAQPVGGKDRGQAQGRRAQRQALLPA